MRRRAGLAPELCHPLALASLATLVVNDHLLKGSGVLPGAVTGKLSDVAGLFVFPLLMLAIARALLRTCGADDAARSRHVIDASAALTVAGFAALKLSPGFNGALEPLWGVNVLDPSDLLTLPAVAASWLLAVSLRRQRHGHAPRFAQGLVVGAAALACMATPAPQYPRNYPAWTLTSGQTQTMGCAHGKAWVSKSGKTGVGLSLQVTRKAQPCAVRFQSARLVLDGAPPVPSSRVPNEGDSVLYIPFPFDNNRMWNNEIRSGTFELALRINGEPVTWSLGAVHRLDGFHVHQPRRYRSPKPPLRRAR